MTTEEIKQKIINIVSEQLNIESSDLKDSNMNLYSSYCMDKLDITEIAIKIEEEFEITLSNFDTIIFEESITIQNLVDYVFKDLSVQD